MKPLFSDMIARRPIIPFIRQSDYAVREPWHELNRRLMDYLLVYIQDGICLFHVEGVEYKLQEGDFCLIQPNELCSLKGITRTITPFAHFDVFYHPDRELNFTTKPGQTDLTPYEDLVQPRLNDFEEIFIPVKFKPSQPVEFKETMLKMIGMLQSADILSQLEGHQLASQLILSLLRDHGSFYQNKAMKPQSLNWITSYFSYHLSESISLPDMAKRAQLSPSRFSTVFTKKFGMPPHQYLLHLRIRHAQELLKDSDFTLAEIAFCCGFADVHHFSKTFKKMTGEPPGSYRSQVK